MIKHRDALSMAESMQYIGDGKDSEAELKKMIKKFVKTKPEEAKKLREKLSSLNLLKLKSESISKIIDIMPENKDDLNKIFADISLDEDETKKILEAIQEFR